MYVYEVAVDKPVDTVDNWVKVFHRVDGVCTVGFVVRETFSAPAEHPFGRHASECITCGQYVCRRVRATFHVEHCERSSSLIEYGTGNALGIHDCIHSVVTALGGTTHRDR